MRSFSLLHRALPALLVPLSLVAACQRQPAAAQAARAPAAAHATDAPANPTAESLPATPAPFATPPLLPGTPDVATLVAKIKPAVVNITAVHELHVPKMEDNFPFGF